MREATSSDFDSIVADAPAVLVDFHATWCQPCKSMEPLLAAVDADTIPVVKVDIEAAPDVASRFGVRSVPTLVLFKGGQAVDVRIGAQQPSALRKWLEDQV